MSAISNTMSNPRTYRELQKYLRDERTSGRLSKSFKLNSKKDLLSRQVTTQRRLRRNEIVRSGVNIPVAPGANHSTIIADAVQSNFKQGDTIEVTLYENGNVKNTQIYQYSANLIDNFESVHKWVWSKISPDEPKYTGDLITIKKLARVQVSSNAETVFSDNLCVFTALSKFDPGLVSGKQKSKMLKRVFKKYKSVYTEGVPSAVLDQVAKEIKVCISLYLPSDRNNHIVRYGLPVKQGTTHVHMLLLPGVDKCHVELRTNLKVEECKKLPVPVSELHCYTPKEHVDSGIVANTKYVPIQDSSEYISDFKDKYNLDPITLPAAREFIEEVGTAMGCKDFMSTTTIMDYQAFGKDYEFKDVRCYDIIGAFKNYWDHPHHKGTPLKWVGPYAFTDVTDKLGLFVIDNIKYPKKRNKYIDEILKGKCINDVEYREYKEQGYDFDVLGGMHGLTSIDKFEFPEGHTNPDDNKIPKDLRSSPKIYAYIVGCLSILSEKKKTVYNGNKNYINFINSLTGKESFYMDSGAVMFENDNNPITYKHYSTYIVRSVFATMARQISLMDPEQIIRVQADGVITRELNAKLLPTFDTKEVTSFMFNDNGLHQTTPWDKPLQVLEKTTLYTGKIGKGMKVSVNSGGAGHGKTTTSAETPCNIACLSPSDALAIATHNKHPEIVSCSYQGLLGTGLKSRLYYKRVNRCSMIIIDEIGLYAEDDLKNLLEAFPTHKIVLIYGPNQTQMWNNLGYDIQGQIDEGVFDVHHFDTPYRLGATEEIRLANPIYDTVRTLGKRSLECDGNCKHCGKLPNADKFDHGFDVNDGVYVFRYNVNGKKKDIDYIRDIKSRGLKITTVESLQGEDNASSVYNVDLQGMSCKHMYTVFTRSGNIEKYKIFNNKEIKVDHLPIITL